MEAKYFIFLGATLVFIPVASWFGIRYRWAERAIVAAAFFSTSYLIDINLVSMEQYRGDTRGFEFGVTDWMIISLIIIMIRSPRWQNRTLKLFPPNSAPIMMYMGVALLSAITAYVGIYSGFGLFKLVRAIAVYWVAYNYLRNEEDLEFFLWILAAIVFMEFILTLKQRATGIYRAQGSTPHSNTLALYINMINMIFMSFVLNDGRKHWRRYVYLAVLGMGTLIVLATFSRGALVMMVGCYGLVIAISLARTPKARKFLMVGIMMLAAIPVAAVVLPSIVHRFLTAPVDAEESRHQANEAAYAMANNHIFGVGINNYSHVINETAYSRFIPFEGDRGIVHNIYLLHACEMGWLGMLVFMVMIGNGMWLGIRQLFSRTDDPPSWMALGIVIGMLSLWIQSLLEWAFRQTYLTVEYFMLAGFLAAMPRVVAATRKQKRKRLIATLLLAQAAQAPRPVAPAST